MNEPVKGLEQEAVIQQIGRKVRIISRRSRKTSDSLEDHINNCERLQKLVLRGVMFLTVWVLIHSPEAAAAFIKLMQLVSE